MEKKICLVLFDCHGIQIMYQLQNSPEFMKLYNVEYLAIYKYTEKGFGETELAKIKNCDMIILQYIKHERPFIHHSIIVKELKKDCRLILLPHYVFSGYWVNFDLPNNFNIKTTKSNLVKMYTDINIDKDVILKNLEDSLNEFKKLEENTTIKMYNTLINNYKNIQLFNTRGYPIYLFFYYMAKEVLDYLKINTEKFQPLFNRFGYNIRRPILLCTKQILGLQFDCSKISYTRKIIFTPIEYYLACKETNKNELNLYKKNDLSVLLEIKQKLTNNI